MSSTRMPKTCLVAILKQGLQSNFEIDGGGHISDSILRGWSGHKTLFHMIPVKC